MKLADIGKKKDNGDKAMEDENISDRAPILDALIEKWKYVIKYKKNMLEKYMKNAAAIREAFDQIMKYLGIDNFQDLPFVLQKMEEQMSSIEIFLSKLTNEIDSLKDQKRAIQSKISALQDKNERYVEEKEDFKESKQRRIEAVKSRIAELNADIEKKRTFFSQLKGPTDEFLLSLEGTYLADYLPKKVAVDKDIQYNESNIVDIIGARLSSKRAGLPETDR